MKPIRARPVLLLLGAAFLAACHVSPRPHPLSWDELSPEEQRQRVLMDAQELSRAREYWVEGRSFSHDCSGYVGAVLYRSGIDVFGGASVLEMKGNGVHLLHKFFTRYGSVFFSRAPEPGDLVFFSNTYDRNKDGKPNDKFTHVGIVEAVEDDGTITFVHRSSRRVRRDLLNLNYPGRRVDPEGKVINGYMRRGTPPPPRLAGILFDGFASLIRSPEKH